MKRSWFGFGILLVLLAGSLGVSCAMARSQEPIARELEQAAAFAQGADLEKAMYHGENARIMWENRRKWVACVADHTPMEELDGLFAQLEARRENSEELAALCSQLAKGIHAMSQAHGLSLWELL